MFSLVQSGQGKTITMTHFPLAIGVQTHALGQEWRSHSSAVPHTHHGESLGIYPWSLSIMCGLFSDWKLGILVPTGKLCPFLLQHS